MDKGYFKSPIGYIYIEGEKGYITKIQFCDEYIEIESPDYINECKKQLLEYFNGERKVFDLKLNPKGTEFQKKIWNELIKIPYGETKSYSEIAKNIGNPKACRAVGNANNKNTIGICIPCHRVIGKNGSLTGYAGGIDKKEYLLNIEKI